MKRKLKILRIISTLDPRAGGPIKAIIDSSLILHKRNYLVTILTSNQKKSNFFKSKKIRIINRGSSLGKFASGLNIFAWLYKYGHEYDAIIIHGIWEYNTLLARMLLKKKYFVYIHGQLDPFFAEDFLKKIKKKIYWFLVERKNLLYSKSIILTSAGEKKSLKKTFVNTNGIKKEILQYGILKQKFNKKKILKKFFTKFPMLKNKNFYLFLGRFHEKKGIDIIIESVKKLENKFNSTILLAGPIKGNNYEKKLKDLVDKYNLQKKILFSNALFGDLKWGAIQASKAMLLSSHGENFGISLVESLSFGKPVLTTFKVNISDTILKYKAGFISKDEVNDFTKSLMKFNNLNKNNLKKMSKNSFNCYKKNFDLSSDRNSLSKFLKKN